MTVEAVVLAGGRSRRLDGQDKARLTGSDGTLLSRAVRSCLEAGAGRVAVVGPERPCLAADLDLPGQVVWTRERPAFGGPARGIAAGVAALGPCSELVIVLACDMPWAARGLARLVECARETQRAGVLAQGPDGHDQWLFGVWRPGPLTSACAGLAPGGSGESARSLLGPLGPRRVGLAAVAVRDIDTWHQARELGYR